MNQVTKTNFRSQKLLWVLRGLMGFVFLATGTMKLIATPMMIEDFNHLGFGLWFMYLTGTLEIIGGLGLLVSRFSSLAALLVLLPICIGALISQLTVFHHDWIHTVIFGLILLNIIYLQRGALISSGKE